MAASLQAGYEDIVNTGSDGISNGCAYKNMCDKAGWDKATKDDQVSSLPSPPARPLHGQPNRGHLCARAVQQPGHVHMRAPRSLGGL